MSTLNCRPGDLAIVLPPRTANHCNATGRLVTVVRRTNPPIDREDGQGFQCDVCEWVIRFQRPIAISTGIGHVESTAWCMHDHRLQPLRDPGEDARDESLSWLPVPSASKEVA